MSVLPLRLLMVLSLVLAAGLGISLYFHFRPVPMPPGIHMPASPAPELKREETVPVLVAEPVQVYRPAVKKKLKLSKAIVDDAAQHVVASSKTANDERQHTITTTLDTTTGQFTSYDRVEPLPWGAVNTKTEIGLFYGLRGGEPIARLQGQQTLLQIKAVRLGATATLDSDGETFIGIGAWARW